MLTEGPAASTTSHAISTASSIDSHAARRAIAAAGLVGIALIHVLDLNGKIHELPYVGWMFIGLIVSALVVTELLIRGDDVRAWLAAGALSAATMVGYAVSRTTGLPGDGDGDVGNWLEPLGLASLVVEGVVVLLAVGRLTARR
jgi:hypothetical protein